MEGLSKKVNKFTIMVNGSKHSLDGYELITKEIFNKNTDFLSLIHVKLKNQNELPYIKRADTVQSLYETKLLSNYTKDHYSLTILDRDEKEPNSISQCYKQALKIKSDCLVVGYHGNTEKPKTELTENIKYLIQNIKIPCFIIKEYVPRKENKGYLWLICIDSPSSLGWSAFLASSNYIKKDDEIVCLHVKCQNKYADKIEEQFNLQCLKIDCKKKTFLLLEKDKSSISETIVNYVNYADITPNFVVLGYNNSKYIDFSSDSSPALNVLKKAQTNVFFYTNI